MVNNSEFNIKTATVKHNHFGNKYDPTNGVFIKVESNDYGSTGNFDEFSVSQAREIAKALNKIADEVEARKPVEKTISQKLSELPNGTVLFYGSNISSADEYHKIGGRFFHKDGHMGYQASSFRALRAWVNGKEL